MKEKDQTYELPSTPPGRGVYANRTLNLHTVQTIGYDMDYTLIHYNVEQWERRASEHLQAKLIERLPELEQLVLTDIREHHILLMRVAYLGKTIAISEIRYRV